MTVGDGSCTTLSQPTHLAWNDPGTGPVVGGNASVRLTGCHQWTPLDGVIGGTTDSAGSCNVSFHLVAGVATIGLMISVQSAWVDLSRSGLPLSVSNGLVLVLDNIGVGNHCASAHFPGSTTNSPWYPFIGQMPVIILDHKWLGPLAVERLHRRGGLLLCSASKSG